MNLKVKNRSFLSYYKTILEKVSFDDFLLTKEYHKAKDQLLPMEQALLDMWMYQSGLMNKLKTNKEVLN